MNEWEIIGRFVDLDNRLRTLEGRPTVQEKPQPVATLCEAVEAFIPIQEKLVGADNEKWDEYDWALEIVKIALTAERKRAVLVKEAFREYKAGHVTNCACRACEALRALDAFDKGAENG